MGFVGFKSHEAAQQAVKHFNKTYMKMSKIAVDIARPVCQFSALLLQPLSFRLCTLTN
jgi:multiple RNA-binding domain-containing protein 1